MCLLRLGQVSDIDPYPFACPDCPGDADCLESKLVETQLREGNPVHLFDATSKLMEVATSFVLAGYARFDTIMTDDEERQVIVADCFPTMGEFAEANVVAGEAE